MLNVIGRRSLQQSHLILAAVAFFAASNVWGQHQNLPVHPPADLIGHVLQSFTIAQASVLGGGAAKGRVTLNIPAPLNQNVSVSLAYGQFISGPPTAVVLAGQSAGTFDMATTHVNGDTNSSVSASYGGVTRTAALMILPPGQISSLSIVPTRLVGGGTVTILVGLNGSYNGATVKLSSSHPALAPTPPSIYGTGNMYLAQNITTRAVTTTTTVDISATYAGSTKHRTLTLDPPSH